MSSVEDGAPGLRRVPAQERSRRRVEAILDATARVVVQEGVAEMTTRSIAVEAGVPPASVYQYYADKEAVLLDMVARDMTEMLAEVLEDLQQLEDFTLDSLIETAVWGAYEPTNGDPP